MARKITGGLVGSSTLVGTVQISPDNALSTAADQNITLSPGGTGIVVSTVDLQLNAQTDLRFADSDSSNWVAFQAPATITADVTWTLPAADGTSGQVLSTNASGTLSWAAAGAAITSDTSTTILYPTMSTATSGSLTTAKITSTKLTFNAATGTLSSTILTASSDARLKENVQPILNALDKVLALEGVLFNRIGSTVVEIGVIAQQVETVVPELVFTDDNGFKSVAYGNTVALLIEAIKEQQIQINELKGKI